MRIRMIKICVICNVFNQSEAQGKNCFDSKEMSRKIMINNGNPVTIVCRFKLEVFLNILMFEAVKFIQKTRFASIEATKIELFLFFSEQVKC